MSRTHTNRSLIAVVIGLLGLTGTFSACSDALRNDTPDASRTSAGPDVGGAISIDEGPASFDDIEIFERPNRYVGDQVKVKGRLGKRLGDRLVELLPPAGAADPLVIVHDPEWDVPKSGSKVRVSGVIHKDVDAVNDDFEVNPSAREVVADRFVLVPSRDGAAKEKD